MNNYFQFNERDNCGVGAIINKYGNPLHDILLKGISALIKLSHRGAIQSDGRTGDGCGLSIQIPDEFFRVELFENDGFQLALNYAAGNIFFSREYISLAEQKSIIIEECKKIGFNDIHFRNIPINVSVLGRIAKSSLPIMEQLFINSPKELTANDFELRLFALRKNIEFKFKDNHNFFICSLSSKTIVYKALCLPRILKEFYLDLANPLVKTSICVFHQRFSTNTQPSWALSQPFRYIAHNGEINTISGNRLWAKARGLSLLPETVKQNINHLATMVTEFGSDSFSLDNMVEMLIISGLDFKQALRIIIPPYWKNNNKLIEEIQKWYETVATSYEPWDGPAGIIFSNGQQVMCCLDRNGLRPLRYSITQNGIVVIASETGILDYPEEEFIIKSRLGAGEMILIDTQTKKILFDQDIYQQFDLKYSQHNNYTTLVLTEMKHETMSLKHDLNIYKKMFMISQEEIENVIKVSALDGIEPTMSMGDDAAIAVLSSKIRPLTDYFRQNFAQVTNPAIDSIREKYVMSLDTYIGTKLNLTNSTSISGYKLNSPIISGEIYTNIIKNNSNLIHEIDLSFDSSKISLEQSIRQIISSSEHAVLNGKTILILSDFNLDSIKTTIPAVMALGAIHNHLVTKELRLNVDLIVSTGSTRDPHQFCILLGFGATAIYPYLSYKIIEDIHSNAASNKDLETLINNYLASINKGILKIMSKMGISTIASYRGAQLFEALGIDNSVTQICFTNAVSRIKGSTFTDIQAELEKIKSFAWNNSKPIEIGGNLKYLYSGEFHAFNPDVVTKLQKAATSGNLEDYYKFANEVNQRPISCLRDLLSIKIPTQVEHNHNVDEVNEICRRFDSAAMSIGALSSEAHQALAIAMNTIGGRSNSGEGGEDPKRFNTNLNSKIKQIASGRFGVTPSYLMSAEIIQIKIAQGAKPGEGGQLPGEKVSIEIGQLRHATPGVTLISPPPHHDVYSIEDLAQLIFDLKQLNPGALISVKLVSEPGIGVIACGVAKAQADLITISGYDGGTGAAPITSVKNVGSPWELGIAETHAALVQNNLRHKIRLQVDGGLKTGLDVIKAAILGAESFGFGTAPMIALGCKYLRICHLNNCATGMATQNVELRQKHFKGLPDMVINYFKGVAHETQHWLSKLGLSQLVDLIGRTDLLEQVNHQTTKKVDLAEMLSLASTSSNYPLYYSEANINHDRGVLNQRIYADCMEAVYNSQTLEKTYTIYNTDRSIGATLAGEIAKNHGVGGLEKPIILNFNGVAGQSFGVWATKGMELYLNGEANDYVGKGLSGGKIVIKHQSLNNNSDITLMGNTCLYGATSGQLFVNGNTGDRFAARNSGVTAVIEGLASNGCEYMTGGVVVILGKIDQNFGAGMTGGICYIWHDKSKTQANLNHDFVETLSIEELGETKDRHIKYLYDLISQHYHETRSARASQFLADFESNIKNLILIKPKNISINSMISYLN